MTNAEATEYLELEIGYLLETNGGTCKEIEADKIALIALREQAEIVRCGECRFRRNSFLGGSYCPKMKSHNNNDDGCTFGMRKKIGKRRESEVSE